jgi:hypothetical protein
MFTLNAEMSEWDYRTIMMLYVRLMRRRYKTRTKGCQLWCAYKHITAPIVAIGKWGFRAALDLDRQQLEHIVAVALRVLVEMNKYSEI